MQLEIKPIKIGKIHGQRIVLGARILVIILGRRK